GRRPLQLPFLPRLEDPLDTVEAIDAEPDGVDPFLDFGLIQDPVFGPREKTARIRPGVFPVPERPQDGLAFKLLAFSSENPSPFQLPADTLGDPAGLGGIEHEVNGRDSFLLVRKNPLRCPAVGASEALPEGNPLDHFTRLVPEHAVAAKDGL